MSSTTPSVVTPPSPLASTINNNTTTSVTATTNGNKSPANESDSSSSSIVTRNGSIRSPSKNIASTTATPTTNLNGTTPSTNNSSNTSILNNGGINTNCHLNGSNNVTTHKNPNYPRHPHSSSTFSLNKTEEYHFVKPPECPIFKPSEDEFKNPLAYIGKIRPFAEKYGIAKIQPPKSWTPPFTVDVDKLKFTPRVQRLNELEAKTRVKLNFLDQIAKFWELQGSSLKIPMVERKALDLYSLHRIVQEEGGIEQTTKERKWSKVAHRMGYPPGKSIGAILKGHYERILHPFDIFTSGKAIDIKLETEIDDQDYKPHGIVSRQQITPPNEQTARRSKRFANSASTTKDSACGLGSYYPTIGAATAAAVAATAAAASAAAASSHIKEEIKDELLQYGGDCKRIHSYGFASKPCGRSNRSRMSSMTPSPIKRKHKENDPLAKYICHICNRGDAEETMLLCDGCDDSYHTFCLIPPLQDIPKGDWRCPKCVVEEVNKPTEAFGFEQAQREYTLQQFGEMADQFKADYFNMSVHLVPTELVEREFWRIVSSIDEDVTVEYGADLHTMDHGSGFPTKSSLYLLPGDQEYAESNWNLNNLPLLEESILGHINADISGMKVPWMYVGMCFATFCWHNEDHWSYSINYLHWGEPKTWYGVPGYKAEAFEETMKMAAPELFHSQPDLLHQLVTIMNPNILMNNGVPVYRTDQQAGEFVITFPRAYHAGFNQGYNFAEAVNFAPADWMKMGRECINHYSMLRRFCVFSHDELVCKMALEPDKLNMGIATACYLDMVEMVDSEKKLRKSLLEWGVTKAEREAFELIPDDERQCDTCKTTCFLSAVTCQCTKQLVCLRHYTELCDCIPEKHTLKYRYTLDELPLMLKKLKIKAASFENWLSRVRDVLNPSTPTTIKLSELQCLAQEAQDLKFPSSIVLERLNSAVLEAEKCVTVIQQLDINKMRTRTRNSTDSAKYKLTIDELDLFVQEIDNLCCIIAEGQSVRELQSLGHEFIKNAEFLLQQKLNKLNPTTIEQLIEEGQSLCIELDEIKLLKYRLEQVQLYRRIREYRDRNEKIPLQVLQMLVKEGFSITPDALLEKELVRLQDILLAIEDWEEVAKKCFESGTQHLLPEIELLLERADDIDGELPSEPALRDAVKKAKEWLHTVDTLQSNENYPYFHTLENVVTRGKNIPFQLEELKRMEEHLDSAKQWKEKTAKTFLKKQTKFHLMDVLSPRNEAIMLVGKKKIFEEQFTEDMAPVHMVNSFKVAEEKEMRDMRELRRLNGQKVPTDDKYCICKQKFRGYMYNCQLCKNWFHNSCVPPPKTTVRPRLTNITPPPPPSPAATTKFQQVELTTPPTLLTAQQQLAPIVPQLTLRERDREAKYLCQSCMRSRRPRLETILSLLVSLQRLPIRLPEGEALQCLTERAMNWQDRVRTAFATKDVASALAALSSLSQKSGGEPIKMPKLKTKLPRKQGDEMETSSDEQEDDSDIESGVSPLSPMKIEHAYSAVTPVLPSTTVIATTTNSCSPGNKLPECKKVIATDVPLIQLSKCTREFLEDLMMEGDLLEVSLDETLHLWRILNAAKPAMSDLALIKAKYKLLSITNDDLVSNKRRFDEFSLQNCTKKLLKGMSPSPPSCQATTPIKVKRGRKMKMITKETDLTILSDSPLSPGLPVSDDATALNIAINSSGKKRKRGTNGNNCGKKSTTNTLATKQQQPLTTMTTAATTTASTSDDDEECSAPNCVRPSGREVDWVQCDGGCNKWFHMHCVGLDKNQIKPDDDYICKRCTKKQTQQQQQPLKPTSYDIEDNSETITPLATQVTINNAAILNNNEGKT